MSESWEVMREDVMVAALNCAEFLPVSVHRSHATFARLGRVIGVSRSQVARWYRCEAVPSAKYRAKLGAMAKFWQEHLDGVDKLKLVLKRA